ncbi:DUF4097 family beta strand repeat-containing protein [Nocardiopsis aegyptia]|uniref:DUF4097 family beta strand repeat-containing protein n=1 Tax=Nocardiopsis aegyptia TaxID=220378 RepID=UPI00366CE233
MHRFDTATPISTVLDIPAGQVRFIAADRSDTTVEVLPANPGTSRDVKAAEQTTVDYADGVLRILNPTKHASLRTPGSVEVTVQLPTGSHIDAKAASAEIRGVGRLGDVAFEGAHGPVKVDEAASVRLTASAGDVTVGRLHGASQITTSQGDIHIAEAVSGALELRTEKGAISVDAAAGVSASLDASTSYGRVHNSLRNSEGASAELAIRATTSYGDITARSL